MFLRCNKEKGNHIRDLHTKSLLYTLYKRATDPKSVHEGLKHTGSKEVPPTLGYNIYDTGQIYNIYYVAGVSEKGEQHQQ